MSKNATHYLPNGKVYTGARHKSGNTLMTGAKHTASSKVLTHTAPKKLTAAEKYRQLKNQTQQAGMKVSEKAGKVVVARKKKK